MTIQAETSDDRSAIRHVHLTSFPGPGETDLVDRLREDGDTVFSLVAIDGGALVGHVLFSRMAAPFQALGLGPVAVLSHRRKEGIAARLIEEGVKRATNGGWAGIFVLGSPQYYQRFGFNVKEAESFECPYAGPHFMALSLKGDRLPAHSGRVDYAPAFLALG